MKPVGKKTMRALRIGEKKGIKYTIYEWPANPNRRRPFQSYKSCKSWFKTNIYVKYSPKVPISTTKQNTMYPIFIENYARSSHWFESGFTGFLGLTIMSPVWRVRLLLNGAFISKPLADALHIGKKKSIKHTIYERTINPDRRRPL